MKGIGVSAGIAIGKARVIRKNEAIATGILLKNDAEMQEEIEKFDRAVKNAIAGVEAIKHNAAGTLEPEAIDILETQIELLRDVQIKSDVEDKIIKERRNAHDAVIEVIRDVVQLFKSLKDEYMSARSADMQDIGNRILQQLNRSAAAAPIIFAPDTILIAEDISPSDTITMDTQNVIGFATQTGGKTSHAAIIAKSRGLPAVVGCGDVLDLVQDNDIVIIDGSKGTVILNPDADTISAYNIRKIAHEELQQRLKLLKDVPGTTLDGTPITLLGNISSAADMPSVFENSGEGVGLFRTELLFMSVDRFPTEAEQFEFYKAVALQSKGWPVIIRTIDIGGDKQLPYFELPVEQNPFLGYRAIRFCLDRKDIFITQLKAILRASKFGPLKIMFPMISNIQELRAAKAILETAKKALTQEGIAFDANIPVGMMIEIPAAAVMADMFAKECDFFSIGTNDLCQYTLAVDRMNEKIAALYDPYNPGILRLIANVIAQANKHDIHVGLCGELASDPNATLLLLGMGLKEFSMSASGIPAIKNIIIQSNLQDATHIYHTVMGMDTSQAIIKYLQEVMP